MKKLAIVIAIAIATTALAASPTPASAGGFNISRSGLACEQAYNEGQVSYYEDGVFYSDATSWWRTALCPVNVDAYSYSPSPWSVFVYDRHYSLDVSCRLVSPTVGGGSSWGQAVSSSGSGPNTQTLTLSPAGGRTMLCYVPPVYSGQRSGIVGYSANITTY